MGTPPEKGTEGCKRIVREKSAREECGRRGQEKSAREECKRRRREKSAREECERRGQEKSAREESERRVQEKRAREECERGVREGVQDLRLHDIQCTVVRKSKVNVILVIFCHLALPNSAKTKTIGQSIVG